MKESKRTFTKRLILLNCMLAWAAIFVSMFLNQSQWIAVSAFGLIASICAYYMEIGHRDLAKILGNVAGNKVDQVPEEVPIEGSANVDPPQ